MLILQASNTVATKTDNMLQQAEAGAAQRPAKRAVAATEGANAGEGEAQLPGPVARAEGGCRKPDTAWQAPAMEARSLARLFTWLSPAFPVGGFSYSHGLEWVVETGSITSAATLAAWIEDVLEHGAGRSDLIFFAEAWRAVAVGDAPRLDEVAALASAFAASAERRLETFAQGAAFLAAVGAVWPHPMLAALARSPKIAYPVAVGASTAAHRLPLAASAQMFLQAFAANLVSAGVRLVPLGQTDGLRVLARLEPVLERLHGLALAASLGDIGGAAILVDIASMRHETQYTRLFRS
jgi:urease accessory protein